MRFTTLLPPAAVHGNGGRRSGRLIDADDPRDAGFQVEATRFTAGADAEAILQVRAWAPGVWAVLGLDRDSVLRCSAWGEHRREAVERWEHLMAIFRLAPLAAPRTLLPPKESHGGPRRSSLLTDADDPDDATLQVSAKRLLTPAGARLLQIRAWIGGVGWTQVVLDDRLGLAAFASADTEKASWNAAQAALRTRGYGV